jgi:Flp pilus assembly protein TadG
MLTNPLKAVRSRTGIAAVEFALILPVMLTLFITVFEVANALICYMKVEDVADTLSDLVAQYQTIGTSDFNNLYSAGQSIMAPASGTPLGVAIASVQFDDNGNPSIAWQITRGPASAMSNGYATSTATPVAQPDGSVIIAQASYTFTSPISFLIPNGINVSATILNQPRTVAFVTCTSPCN